jgi:thiamine monophosphate synthase
MFISLNRLRQTASRTHRYGYSRSEKNSRTYIIGATANTFEDITTHVQNTANYIGLGPFQFTTTKQKLSPILGLEGYRSILQKLKQQRVEIPILPLVASHQKM